MKSLRESLFDSDLVTREVDICGVKLDKDLWNKCKEFFKSLSAKSLLRSEFNDYKVLYEGNDCIILLFDQNGESDRWMYVFSTETVYMNYLSIRHNHPIILDIDEVGIVRYSRSIGISKFAFINHLGYLGNEQYWYKLAGCFSSIPSRSEGIGDEQLVKGYIPLTISNKAKKIIEKYV